MNNTDNMDSVIADACPDCGQMLLPGVLAPTCPSCGGRALVPWERLDDAERVARLKRFMSEYGHAIERLEASEGRDALEMDVDPSADKAFRLMCMPSYAPPRENADVARTYHLTVLFRLERKGEERESLTVGKLAESLGIRAQAKNNG